MSIGDKSDGFHSAFTHYMPHQYMVDIPSDEFAFADFDTLLGEMGKNIAGVFIEPLVQGAGGMKFHTADILAEIYRICKKHDVLFIADEIFTGFGRTGLMFACDEAGFSPDILCVGKALTGGAMSSAATIATNDIFDAFLSDSLDTALMHGPTYMANPLACAAGIASLELFEKEPRLKQCEKIELQLLDELAPCKKLSGVKDVRVKGAIGVVELEDAPFPLITKLRQDFIKQGVWLRPFGNIAYIVPAFTMSEKDLSTLCNTTHAVLKKAL
jgi:adenosylmethionine-8-amino-7-oxononanoate aminotransferase